MSIHVRDARASDGPRVMRLWKEATDYHRAFSTSDLALDEDAPRLWLKSYKENLKRKQVKFLVAERKGAIIGYLMGQVHQRPSFFKTKQCGFIGELAVTGSERGKGIGRRLLDAYLEWARKKGLSYINLFVDSRNRGGRAFWREAGFETVMLQQRRLIASTGHGGAGSSSAPRR